MWMLMPQQQQRGNQFGAGKSGRVPEAPEEAVKDRDAQDHEQAGPRSPDAVPRGGYPASRIEDRDDDPLPGGK